MKISVQTHISNRALNISKIRPKHYTYFHTLFHLHIFIKKLKTIIQIHVSNGPLILASWSQPSHLKMITLSMNYFR